MTMTIIPPAASAGQETPRSREVLVQHVRAEARCGYCGSGAGTACRLRGGVHMGRIVRAFVEGRITVDELAIVVKPLGDRFTGATIIRDGAR